MDLYLQGIKDFNLIDTSNCCAENLAIFTEDVSIIYAGILDMLKTYVLIDVFLKYRFLPEEMSYAHAELYSLCADVKIPNSLTTLLSLFPSNEL